MRLDWVLVANLETALCALWGPCAQAAQHPIATAAVLVLAFLLLTCSRARFADRQGALIGGNGNGEV